MSSACAAFQASTATRCESTSSWLLIDSAGTQSPVPVMALRMPRPSAHAPFAALPVALAQHVLLELPGRGPRQGGDELDRGRALEVREPAAAELEEVGF